MAKILVYQIWAGAWPSLREMQYHLKRIAALGANYVWLSGILKSPQHDHGYDVSDYRAIDPLYGTMEEFDDFVETARRYNIGVLLDLVLNHTSVDHPWFREHPEYYCWSNYDRPGWKNLFDEGPAWKYDAQYGQYYCHLFHETQADLNWFPIDDHTPDQTLVHEFRDIVKFWTKEHRVAGFRLDVPQGINKDFYRDTLEFNDLIFRMQAPKVLNAIFPSHLSHPFLMMECFDPTFGDIADYYAANTQVDFVMNVLLKSTINSGAKEFKQKLKNSALNPKYMVDIESHDSPRFSHGCWNSIWGTHQIFQANPRAVCIYQGQELGLANPTPEQLTYANMIGLDAETAMKVCRGVPLESLRSTSRANARVPLPLDKYDKQENDPKSCLNLVKLEIQNWRLKR